jgi:hypothetical protein
MPSDLPTSNQPDKSIIKPVHPVTLSPSHLVILILLVYLIIGTLYATQTPRWQVPDEPAHYNYIRQLVTQHIFPVLAPGDYNQAYLSELTSTGFPPDKPIDSLEYEDHQPPLYYLLAAPIFILFNGALLPLRLFSLLLGAFVIFFAWLVVCEVFPEHEVLALTAAGFIAFIPQHIAVMAGVNNDSLAELLMSLGLWLTLKYLKSNSLGLGPWPLRLGPWALSLVLGATFLTKTTIYPLAVIVALMLLLKARREAWNARQLLIAGLKIFLPALVLGGLWWGRDLAVYGGTDILGLQRHNAVVIGQPRTSEWLATYGTVEVARRFFLTTFHSFWGQFGWMGVVMDQRVYLALALYSIGLVVGVFIALFRQARHRLKADGYGWLSPRSGLNPSTKPDSPLPEGDVSPGAKRSGEGLGVRVSVGDFEKALATNTAALAENRPQLLTRFQRESLLLLLTSALLTLGLYLYYNLSFVQHQGRYLFPALIPIGLAAAMSLQTWGKLAEKIVRFKIGWLIPLGALLAMAALDVFALYRFILPALPHYG